MLLAARQFLPGLVSKTRRSPSLAVPALRKNLPSLYPSRIPNRGLAHGFDTIKVKFVIGAIKKGVDFIDAAVVVDVTFFFGGA